MQKNVVSLYDESGNMLRPWAKAGYDCYCFDILNQGTMEEVGAGRIYYMGGDLRDSSLQNFIVALNPVLMCGFPPCTDLAVSGAAHFQRKLERNPKYRDEAMELVKIVPELANRVGCPYFIENPVSVISSLWRKPDFMFSPWQYGGYLPEDDIHPRWPDYIAARDAYPKKTCLWTGNGFTLPEFKPVEFSSGYSTQHKKLGGKSAKTKQIRSETPRGFSQAVFEKYAEKEI